MLNWDKESMTFGRKKKDVPILRDKRVYITFENNYEKLPEEIEMGEKFIIFTPQILFLESEKQLHYRAKDLQRKLKKTSGLDIGWLKMGRKKVLLVLNKNTQVKENLDKFLKNEICNLDNNVMKISQASEEYAKKWVFNHM